MVASGLPPELGLLPVLMVIPHADRSFGVFAEAEAFLAAHPEIEAFDIGRAPGGDQLTISFGGMAHTDKLVFVQAVCHLADALHGLDAHEPDNGGDGRDNQEAANQFGSDPQGFNSAHSVSGKAQMLPN